MNIANKQSIPIEIGGETIDDATKIRSPSAPIAVKKPSTAAANICELNLIAKMNQLTWNMFDTNLTFGQMAVKELSVNYNLSGVKTSLRCQLKKILIDYGNEVNQCYKQIISCTGDGTSKKFFDLNLTLYDTTYLSEPSEELNDVLKLAVGRIKVFNFGGQEKLVDPVRLKLARS